MIENFLSYIFWGIIKMKENYVVRQIMLFLAHYRITSWNVFWIEKILQMKENLLFWKLKRLNQKIKIFIIFFFNLKWKRSKNCLRKLRVSVEINLIKFFLFVILFCLIYFHLDWIMMGLCGWYVVNSVYCCTKILALKFSLICFKSPRKCFSKGPEFMDAHLEIQFLVSKIIIHSSILDFVGGEWQSNIPF